jgi:acyl carrier protein
MNEFLHKIAAILEVDEVKERDDMKAFPQWDSLAVLSVIAMLDASYGVTLHANDFKEVNTAGDLWTMVQSKKNP